MLVLGLRYGLMNTLGALLVSIPVYLWSTVHPLGQFRLLLGVVTLGFLILAVRDLKYRRQGGQLKMTDGLQLCLGMGAVAGLSFGLLVWLSATLFPSFWQAYLADQVQNLQQASGILDANYAQGTRSQLTEEVRKQSPASLALRLSGFRAVWHLVAGSWVALYFRN